MKALILTLCLSFCAHAGTFTLSTSMIVPLAGSIIPGELALNVSHTYDDDTLKLVDSDWSWSASTLIRAITQDIELVPPIFPNPPVTEKRTVTETIEILHWPSTSKGRHSNKPISFTDSDGMFRFGGEAFVVWDPITPPTTRPPGLPYEDPDPIVIRRTLVGPFSTQEDILELTLGESYGGEYSNVFINNQWEPEGPYVGFGGHPRVPSVMHDGVEVFGVGLANHMPLVVPEPNIIPGTMFLLLCLIFAVNLRRYTHVPGTAC